MPNAASGAAGIRPVACAVCLLILAQSLFAVSAPPVYEDGRDINQPLDTQKIDKQLFVAFRLAAEQMEGKQRSPLHVIPPHVTENARTYIKEKCIVMRDEFDRKKAEDDFNSVFAPSIESAKAVRFLLVDLRADRLEDYDFDRQSFILRRWNYNPQNILIAPNRPGWFFDENGTVDVLIPLPDALAAKWKKDEGRLLGVFEIADSMLGETLVTPEVNIGPAGEGGLSLIPRKYVFQGKTSGVIAEVPVDQAKVLDAEGNIRP